MTFRLSLSPRLKPWIPHLLLALAVFVAYANVYGNAFLYDDESLILYNRFLKDWSHVGTLLTTSITAGANIASGFYRPLQMVLYLLVYHAAGPSTFAFHLLNVSLHAADACLVYALARKLNFTSEAAFLGALLWALHPLQVEAIAYMSSTADPLYVFFCLAALVILLPDFAPRKIFAVIPLFILGLLSKETAIVLPLLAMSCLFLLSRERLKPKTYLRLWPLWAVAALYYLAHKTLLNFDNFQLYRQHDEYATSILCRFYTFLATLPHYLQILIWPAGLHFDRNFPPVTDPWQWNVMAGLALLIAAAAQIVWGKGKRGLAFSWGLLWFAGAHILHTGIFVPVNAMFLEHWLYLPSVGLILGSMQSIFARAGKAPSQAKRVDAAGIAAIALILGIATFNQGRVWHDSVSLYTNIFANGEPSPHAHNNLAIIYTRAGEYRKALEQYNLSIKLSGDTNAEAQHNLGITLLNGPEKDGKRDEAIMHFKRALEIDPNYYPAANALAALYEQQGDKEQAKYYRQRTEEIRTNLNGTAP